MQDHDTDDSAFSSEAAMEKFERDLMRIGNILLGMAIGITLTAIAFRLITP